MLQYKATGDYCKKVQACLPSNNQQIENLEKNESTVMPAALWVCTYMHSSALR